MKSGRRGFSNLLLLQVTVSKSSDGNVSSSLLIDAVDWDDAGTYSCVAAEKTSAAGSKPSKQDIVLDVFAAPKKASSWHGRGVVGETADLACSFAARPTPDIKWLRFGSAVESDLAKYAISVEEDKDRHTVKSYLKILG